MGFFCFFLYFYGFFRSLECFHDVPDPPAIVFGPGITQNGGMRPHFDQFLIFWTFFGTPWDPLGPLGTPWDHLGPLGTTWDPLGPLGTPWDHLGPLGPLGPRILKGLRAGGPPSGGKKFSKTTPVLKGLRAGGPPSGGKKFSKTTPVFPGVQFSGFFKGLRAGGSSLRGQKKI